MSRQMNIFLTPGDTTSLEQSWRALGPLWILHSRSPRNEPRILPSSDLEEANQRWLFFYLTRREDLQAAVLTPVPAQGYWTIDVLRSPVIELSRCFFDGRILRRGRMYFVDGFHDAQGAWVEKSEGFNAWAKAVFSTTKKALSRHGTDYIGSEARSWLAASGGSLVS